MQMAVEKPDPPVFSYKFQGIFNVFNASVFSELAVHTETKMIILRVDRGKVADFFQVNRQGGDDD